jgi:hypothetical protein
MQISIRKYQRKGNWKERLGIGYYKIMRLKIIGINEVKVQTKRHQILKIFLNTAKPQHGRGCTT